MKKLLNISFALLILLSSIGVSINKMKCSTGKEKFSFLKIKDCCKKQKNNDSSALAKKCCDFSTDYLQVSIPSIVFYHFITIAQLDLMSISTAIEVSSFKFQVSNFKLLFSHSPPLLNSTALVITGILRI